MAGLLVRSPLCRVMRGDSEARDCALAEVGERVRARICSKGSLVKSGWFRRAEMTALPWDPVAPVTRI